MVEGQGELEQYPDQLVDGRNCGAFMHCDIKFVSHEYISFCPIANCLLIPKLLSHV